MDQILKIKENLMNEEFDALADSQKRVEYTFEKIGPIDDIRYNVHKSMRAHKTGNMKSLVKSQELREKGTMYLAKGDFESAVYYFTSALMNAPYPTESDPDSDNELTYAFTARSLSFFEMKAYENALFDINCALNLSEFSMKFSERLQLMVHKVYCLCRLRRYYTGLTVISTIIQLIPCLPIHNQTVKSLIQMKDQITERINEEESDDMNHTQSEMDIIEHHLKNIESFKCPELELCETEDKGRHYRAVEAIPKGKLVIVEKALTGVLFKAFFGTHCDNCFKNIGYKCWPCKQCTQVVFCDQECAENAYYHSYECGFVDVLNSLGTNHHLLYRLILLVGPQMAIELVKETSNQMDVSGDSNTDSNTCDSSSNETDIKKQKYLKFTRLLDHRDKYCLRTKVPTICRSIQLAFIFDFFEEFRPEYQLIEDYLKELSALLDTFNYKASVNVFGIYEYMNKNRAFRGGHIGNAIMFESSFFNHSCSPNTYWIFNGLHISVVTTENIEEKQEVCISYGPYSQSMTLKERQTTLKNRYFFRCNCKDCMNESKSLPTLKCNICSDGFFVYETDSTESSCMSCGQNLNISSVVKMVKEIEESFSFWMNEFNKNGTELQLLRAEECHSKFCEFLYQKSDRMVEINSILSRSFETFEDYSKAMVYSKNILDSLNDTESFRYCIEMVFFSRVYYYSLFKQRKVLDMDEEWRHCYEVMTKTLDKIKKCKNSLVEKPFNDKSDLEVITKAIQLLDGCLKSKEQQIRIISEMIEKPIDN